MARLFTSGAEEHDPYALWDYFSNVASYTQLFVAMGDTGRRSTKPRTGRGMYMINGTLPLRNDFVADTTKTELFFGFAINVPVLGTAEFFTAYTDTASAYANRLGLRLNVSGGIDLLKDGALVTSSANSIIAIDTWYYFEVWFKPLNTNGRAVVKVDSNTVIDYTGDTTNDREYINAYLFNGVDAGQTYGPTAFDDIVVNDASGSANNTYPGQVRLLPIHPTNPGTYSGFDRAGVDLGSDDAQARNGSFEYAMMQTSAADAKQTFDPEIPDLPAGASITNIIVTARARVEDGSGVIAPMIISGSTEAISADQTLTPGWKYKQYAWNLDPADSSAWTEADLANLEIGVSS